MKNAFASLPLTHAFSQLGEPFCVPSQLIGLHHPTLHCLNHALVKELGLPVEYFQSNEWLSLFAYQTPQTFTHTVAQAYAGHQFGRFNPFLGDGRCLLLGEIHTPLGHQEVVLKGSGKTPYAYQADGRASLTECLREYHYGEELNALNIKTTRILCVISGDDLVYRAGFQTAAIAVRIAPSHLRYGHFELFYFQQNHSALEQLALYLMQRHFPDCLTHTNPFSALFTQIILRSAKLIAQWQAARFVHGVMNTDNQSLIGLTLDLGHCAFLDPHETDKICHPHDEKGRYAFSQQAVMGLWNANVLARALSPLIEEPELIQALRQYEAQYLSYYAKYSANPLPTPPHKISSD